MADSRTGASTHPSWSSTFVGSRRSRSVRSRSVSKLTGSNPRDAVATALRATRQGQKTLVLSSDPAHSPADALDRQLGDQLIVQVANQRSSYVLPNFLNCYTMTDAALEGGALHVRFTPDSELDS